MPSKTHVENIKRLQEIYDKLDNQSIVKEELDELVRVSANLYEKAVILRYKAAEERVFGDVEKEVVKPEPIQEETKVVDIPKQDTIDFSIFEKKEPEVKQEVKLEGKAEPTPILAQEIEPVDVIKDSKVDWSKHFENVLKNHDSGIQTPLSSIAGSFGLNERILYTNELFDGEAEKFSACVQKLDATQEWSVCVAALTDFATRENWESGNDAIDDFVVHVNRKYA